MNNTQQINEIILETTKSVIVQTPKYSKFGSYDGTNDIYTMDIAEAIDRAGYRKVVMCKDCDNLGTSTNGKGYLIDCENCGDNYEPCGFCRYWGDCVSKDGFCYHGERRKSNADGT